VANLERRFTLKLLKLARKAREERLFRTERAILERVLELDPDQSVARRGLGFKRSEGEWVRAVEELQELQDWDFFRPDHYRQEKRKLEEWYISEIARICGKYGTPGDLRRYLRPLLEKYPQHPVICKALGFIPIRGRYVRPGLVDLAEHLPRSLDRWRACAAGKFDIEGGDFALALPGLTEELRRCTVDTRKVAGTLPVGRLRSFARWTARSQLLARELLGEKTQLWNPEVVVVLDRDPYLALLRAAYPDDSQFRLYSRFGSHQGPGYVAFWASSSDTAADQYAHAVGLRTMSRLTWQAGRESYAWLQEGFGYLLSFELLGSGYTWYVSLKETTRKVDPLRKPPNERSRRVCLDWVRDQMKAGRADRLRDLCGRSLNNLDFYASMETYSFVRFLFLYDPVGARHLPAALRAQTKDAQVFRTDRALRETFGKGIDEMEILWRAFVLELGQR